MRLSGGRPDHGVSCLDSALGTPNLQDVPEPSVEQGVEFRWSIFLNEVAGKVDEFESARVDQTPESVPSVDWYPIIRTSPHDQGGDLDMGVEGFDLVGVSLVTLGDLPVERGLSRGSEPGRYQGIVDAWRESLVAGTSDVLAHQRLVQVRWELGEDIWVVSDQAEEW
jgi:hypothetical protein